jgi:hypothetical protein
MSESREWGSFKASVAQAQREQMQRAMLAHFGNVFAEVERFFNPPDKRAIQWTDIDWERGTIHINRLKGSDASTHKLQGDMLRALRRLKREQQPKSPFIFTYAGAAGSGQKARLQARAWSRLTAGPW